MVGIQHTDAVSNGETQNAKSPKSANGHCKDSSTSTSAEQFRSLVLATEPVLTNYWSDVQRDDASVTEHVDAEDLDELLALNLPQEPVSDEKWLGYVKQLLAYSTKIGNPRYLDKLCASVYPAGAVAELVTGTVNSNGHVFAAGQVAILMERAIILEIRSLLGMPSIENPAANGVGGVMCPGGSMSNMLALVTARNAMFPEFKNTGMSGKRLVAFTSSHCHYSVTQAAVVAGIGLDNVIKVRCNDDGRMSVEDLESQIEATKANGGIPFFVNATAGTTVMGAFDPLDKIGAIARKHGLWFHVDGAWGGSVAFSRKHSFNLRGSADCDSFVIDAHKLAGIPQQCSILVTRESDILSRSNTLKAGYLFHNNPYDLGESTLGCGRRPDAIKWFLTWQHIGTKGFEARVDRAMENASILRSLVSQEEKLHLLHDQSTLNVCFYYLPSSLRYIQKYKDFNSIKEALESHPGHREELGLVTAAMRKEIMQRGRVLFDYAPLPQHGLPPFFRIPMCSNLTEEKHLQLVISEILSVGSEMFP